MVNVRKNDPSREVRDGWTTSASPNSEGGPITGRGCAVDLFPLDKHRSVYSKSRPLSTLYQEGYRDREQIYGGGHAGMVW